MKLKSLLLSFLLVLGGIFGGALSFSMPISTTQAVSEDASVWDGKYPNSVSELDFYRDPSNHEVYIYTAAGFAYFAQTVSNGESYTTVDGQYTIYLEEDIDLNNHEWSPIGTIGYTGMATPRAFAGTFDGQGHKIYNMTISETKNNNYAGLFANVEGNVKNLHLENVNISNVNSTYVGGIAGQLGGGNLQSSIENCSVSGKISLRTVSSGFSNVTVGGLVGIMQNNSLISKSANYANISGNSDGNNIGGIAGRTSNSTSISECFNSGNLSSWQGRGTSNSNVGGIVGFESNVSSSSYLTIQNSYNTGDIEILNGYVYAGGILGFGRVSESNNYNYFRIMNVYNSGDFVVNGSGYSSIRIGGIVGYMSQATNYSASNNCISGAFNIGNFEGTLSGVVISEIINYSRINGIDAETVFYDSQSSYPFNYGTSVVHLAEKAGTLEFLEDHLGWDLDVFDVRLGLNDALPYLISIYDEKVNNDIETTLKGDLEGEGTAEDPYRIYTPRDLQLISDTFNNFENAETEPRLYFSLQNNIDLSDFAWTPIGYGDDYTFSNAVFDGNNFTISGVSCSMQQDFEYVGLFGKVENAVIKNLIISDFRFIGSSSSNVVMGTLAASAENSYIINCGDADSRYDITTVGEIDDATKYIVGENTVNFPLSYYYVDVHVQVVTEDVSLSVEYNGQGLTLVSNYWQTSNGEEYNYNFRLKKIVGQNLSDYSINYIFRRGNDIVTNNTEIIYKLNYSYTIDKVVDEEVITYTYEFDNLNSITDPQGLNVAGYMVGIDANGGTIYDVASQTQGYKTHKGKAYFILLDNGGSYSIDTNIANYDSTFLTSLPVDTLNANDNSTVTQNVIVNEGNIINGYTFGDEVFDVTTGATQTYIGENLEDLILNGITANWTVHEDIDYTIYYNSYEYYQGTKGEKYQGITGDTAKSVTITKPYNSFWSTADILSELEAENITREGFEIEGVYDNFAEGAFSNQLDSGNSGYGFFVNFDNDLYIKWQGNTTYSIKIRLLDQSILAGSSYDVSGNFDLRDVLSTEEGKGIVVSVAGNVDTVYDSSDLEFDGEGYFVTHDYLTSDVDEINDNISINVTLKSGYQFDNQTTSNTDEKFFLSTSADNFINFYTDDDTGYIGDYGRAYFGYPTNIGNSGDITLSFSQIVGNADVDLYVARTAQRFGLTVENEVKFGIAPAGQDALISGTSNIDFLLENQNGFVPFTDYNYTMVSQKLGSSNNFYFGMNMFSDLLIASTTNFDCFDPKTDSGSTLYTKTTSDENKATKQLVVRITTTQWTRYFLFDYNAVTANGVTTYTQDIYSIVSVNVGEHNFRYEGGFYFKVQDWICQISYSSGQSPATSTRYEISYYTDAEFSLIFSTESDELVIDNYTKSTEDSQTVLPTELKLNTEINTPQKLMYDFSTASNFTTLTDLMGVGVDSSTGMPEITISLERTVARFYIRFVDENGHEITTGDLPTVYFDTDVDVDEEPSYTASSLVQVNVNESQSISFRLENSTYYQWKFRDKGDSTIPIFNDIINENNLVSDIYIQIAQDNAEYELGADFSNYFELEYTSINNGTAENPGANSDRTAFEFKLIYDGISENSMQYDLLAYDYNIYIVLEEKQYNLSEETKFRQTNAGTLYDDTVGETRFVIYDSNGEDVTGNYLEDDDFKTYIGVADSSIRLELMAMDNKTGYNFTEFRVFDLDEYQTLPYNLGAGNNQALTNNSVSLFDFIERYENFITYDDATDTYMLCFYSIYQSDTVTYNVSSSRFLIKDYNGYSGDYYLHQQNIITFGGDGNNQSGTYYYSVNPSSTSDLSDVLKSKFSFSLSHTDYYTFEGIAILSDENYNDVGSDDFTIGELGYTILLSSENSGLSLSENGLTLSWHGDLIKEHLRTNIADYQDNNIYIVPILKQRTLLVSFSSGVESTDDYQIYDYSGTVETTDEIIQIVYYYNSSLNIEFDNYFNTRNVENPPEYNLISNNNGFTDNTGVGTITLNRYYYQQIGYTADAWRVGTESSTTTINSSRLRIDNIYFSSLYVADEGSDYDYEIIAIRTWRPNTYTVSFSSADDRNVGSLVYGAASGTMAPQTATYGQYLTLNPNAFSITGYDFVGWNTMIDGTGESFGDGDQVLNLCTGAVGDTIITLYAQWQAKEYEIEIVLNSGSVNGSTDNLTYKIVYNTDFTNLFTEDESGTRTYLSLSEIVPERAGFTFDGFYVLPSSTTNAKYDVNLIRDNTVFNTSVNTFADADCALTLYATWIYAGDVSISVDNETNRTYTGQNISVNLTEYQFSGNSIVIVNDENGLSLSNDYVDTIFSTEYGANASISVNGINLTTLGIHVGTYSITLTVRLTDTSLYYNLGNVFETTLTLIINVEQATVSYAENGDTLKLQNVKHFVSLVEDSETIEVFNAFSNYDELANYIRTIDSTAAQASGDFIYEYLIMKYYNMANANFTNFRTFRNWTYSDYLAYYEDTNYFGQDEFSSSLEGERLNRAEILSNFFFITYDVLNSYQEYVLYDSEDMAAGEYNSSQVLLTSQTAVNVTSELTITRIVAIAYGTMTNGLAYEVRAYISPIQETYRLDYILNSDGDESYILLDTAYMHMDILRLENNAQTKSTFFNSAQTNVNVNWAGANQGSYVNEINYTYYQIAEGSNLYLNMDITTSNGGSADVDTNYYFYDDTNYFLNETYQVLLYIDDTYFNVTQNVNVLLDESFTFTIYNVANAARFTLNTSLLTKQDGYLANTELAEEYTENLFVVTGFTYSLDGLNTETVTNENGLADGIYTTEDGGVLLFTITGNSSASPVFTTSEAIISVDINVTRRYPAEFNKLYNFSNFENDTFIDNPDDSGSYTITLANEEIEYQEDAITELNYYAVFTDLVKVVYDLNLPLETGSSTESYLQLGVDTAEDIITLSAEYLQMSRLVYVDGSGHEEDYETIFQGENGTYVGILEDNIFADVHLKAYWVIAEASVMDNMLELTYSVGTPVTIYASNAGSYGGEESEFFNYYYEIIFNNEVLAYSTSYSNLALNFTDGGRLDDSGTYTITMTATIKEEFEYILDEGSDLSIHSEELDFELTFVPVIIDGVTYLGDTSTTYNGADHKYDFSYQVNYRVYDSGLGDYSEEVYQANFAYGNSDNYTIQISDGTQVVNAMRDVGTYTISFVHNSNYYILNEALEGQTFETQYTINKYTLDLSLYPTQMTKRFNTSDGDLTRNILINSETIVVNMTRDAGEDLGSYSLYFSSFSGVTNSNYIITYDGTTLYDRNGNYQNTTTQIGTFTIVQSGTLRIYWQETEDTPTTISAIYDEDGYTVGITSAGQIVIYVGGDVYRTMSIVLYDVAAGAQITSSAVLSILQPYLTQIGLNFYDGSAYYDVIDTYGTYSFNVNVDADADITDYYSNFIFASNYFFQVAGRELNIRTYNITKEFDGNNMFYLTIAGSRIENIGEYAGVYLAFTYDDIHVGSNISVTAAIASTDSQAYDPSNYSLTSNLTVGEITKKTATITFEMLSDTYTYGGLSLSNLAEQVTYQVVDEDGVNVTAMFSAYSNYDFAFSLSNSNDKINSLGYYYAGSYSLVSSSIYEDFDMTEVLPDIQISRYQLSLVLPAGYITINTLDNVEPEYTETRILQETGDSFEVAYVPVGAVQGTVGNYNLALVETIVNNCNVELTLNENNNAFSIVAATGTLYLEIQNPDILTQIYNARAYTITTDKDLFTITIENEDESFVTVSSRFNFYYYDDNSDIQYLDSGNFTTIDIFYNTDTHSFTEVGSYKLTLDAVSPDYTRVVFAENYYFTINKRTVDVSTLDFTKTYDGSATIDITLSTPNGVLEGDTVQVHGVYASSNAGSDIDVTLYLNGADANNYELSATTATGDIEKASATISLSATSYSYGLVTSSTVLNFIVTNSDGNQIASTQYSVSDFAIQGGSYSDNGYLLVGDYSVTITTASDNYNISLGDLNFSITKYNLNLSFSSNGYYYTSYGSAESRTNTFERTYETTFGDLLTLSFTRISGVSVGYYKINPDVQVLDNDNYIVTASDTSALGAYRIIVSSDKLYILASDEAVLEDGEEGTVLEIEYDSNTYDQIELVRSENNYQIVVSSTLGGVSHAFDVNIYTYSDGFYYLTDIFDETIVGQLSLNVNNPINQVNRYTVQSDGASSQNFDIVLGKNAALYAYIIEIVPRKLYFKEDVISKVFDNQNAVLIFDDASTYLDRILNNDLLTLTVTFYDGEQIARYGGSGYTITGQLSDNDNYELVLTTADGTAVTGEITKANLNVIVYSQSSIYGNNFTLGYEFASDDVDLYNYDTSRITFTLSVANPVYSTAGYLTVGEYNLAFDIISDDFEIYRFICDGVSVENLISTLTITTRTINIVEKADGLTLGEIFSKVYDGTDIATVSDESGLLFDLNNVMQGSVSDDVTVDSAVYAQSGIGYPITVNFTLSGVDAANYTVTPYQFGRIEAVVIGLEFDYQSADGTVVSSADEYGIVSRLNYPFVSTSYNTYLTANSADTNTSSTQNFPHTLTDTTGSKTFVNWTLNFANISENSDEYNFLLGIAGRLGLDYDYTNNLFKFTVSNSASTVNLLNELLTDENDYFGYNYVNNDDITFTFTANWAGNEYAVYVETQDKDGGLSTAYGNVEINDVAMTTSTYRTTMVHGTEVRVEVDPNDHIKILGFYDIYTGQLLTGDNYDITTDNATGITTFTVRSLTAGVSIAIRFAYKDVAITLDLTDYSDVTFDDDNFSKLDENLNIYIWSTTYDEIDELMLSDMTEPIREGFEISSYEFNNDENSIVQENDFDSTYLADFVKDAGDDYEIYYKVNFSALSITVTLDYAYDNRTEEIQVDFMSAYNTAIGWVESVDDRVGYTFTGWYLGDNLVVGTDIVTQRDDFTLTAHWEIKTNTVVLTIDDHITFVSADYENENSENTYTFSDVDYGTTINFNLRLQTGYEIDSLQYYFEGSESVLSDVQYEVAGNDVSASFSVPEPPTVHIVATSKPRSNTVTIDMQYVDSFSATSDDIALPSTESTFNIETGNVATVVLTIKEGYEFTGVTYSDTNVTNVSEPVISGNTVTLMIDNITADFTLTISVTERINIITIELDDMSLLESVVVNGIADSDGVYEYEVATGDIFTFYLRLSTGYQVDTAAGENYEISFNLINDTGNYYNGYFQVDVTNIARDGTIHITTARVSYTLQVEIIAYDESQNVVENTSNTAYVYLSGQTEDRTSVTAEFLTEVTLIANASLDELYSFAGWSRDGVQTFSNDNPLEYIINQNETIYAIFSKLQFNVSFEVYDNYNLYEEYNDPTRTREVYELLSSGNFYQDDQETLISGLNLYYGASTNIYFEVPEGYMYQGYGYISADGEYEYILNESSTERMISLSVSSFDMDINNTNVVLFVILNSYEANLNITSWIDYDNFYEQDFTVGNITLVDSEGNAVNQYGYVEGTRNHYETWTSSDNVDIRNFTVNSYTNNYVYLQVRVGRNGYTFSDVQIDNYTADVFLYQTLEVGDEIYYIYRISNFIGGADDIEVHVYFKPHKNVVSLNFINENSSVVNGGSFLLGVSDDMEGKVWADGQNFSTMRVVGFSDTTFTVSAYIRLGFMIDESNLSLIYDESLLTISNIQVAAMLFEETNYSYILKFDVSECSENADISIVLMPQTYIVQFVDETLGVDSLIAEIRNVKYHEVIDLSLNNRDNITVYNEEISFTTSLNLVQTRQNYNFGGYFTYPGGSGTQYINASGLATREFTETGYIFDEKNQIYVLSDNATITDQGIVITLYLYWSYLKTQITFEIVPDINISATAMDIAQGTTTANSWFYSQSPLYIEVAFNTAITLTAPQISGYRFYSFVIRQRDANNNWLTDVVSYSETVPWSTNEVDNIVECNIQLIYFARVDVQVYGGEMEYEISQDTDNAMARSLIRDGYVDTTKNFTLTALEDESEGYEFVYWQNISTGQRYPSSTSLETRITSRTVFLLYVQGREVTLLFDEYDATHGQIVSMQIQTISGAVSTRPLGVYSNGEFVKVLSTNVNVGDTVTFLVSVDFGYSVTWNLPNITLSSMTSEYYYFQMEILGSFASGSDSPSVQIVPTFTAESVAFYIYQAFDEDEYLDSATDNNDASLAGYVEFAGENVTVITSSVNSDISFVVHENDRYNLIRIYISSASGMMLDLTEMLSDGTINLTRDFMAQNSLAGTLQLNLIYERLLYGDEIVEEVEGDGTEDSPYRIRNENDLAYFMNLINSGAVNEDGRRYADCHYVVESNINLSSKFWTPIGTSENPFNGVFNFDGHTISGIYLARYYSSTSYNGLFGVLGSNAQIYTSIANYWYVYIIVAIILLLIALLIILIVTNKKKKKRREELNTK